MLCKAPKLTRNDFGCSIGLRVSDTKPPTRQFPCSTALKHYVMFDDISSQMITRTYLCRRWVKHTLPGALFGSLRPKHPVIRFLLYASWEWGTKLHEKGPMIRDRTLTVSLDFWLIPITVVTVVTGEHYWYRHCCLSHAKPYSVPANHIRKQQSKSLLNQYQNNMPLDLSWVTGNQ